MQFVKAILQYDEKVVEFLPNKMTFFDELYLDFKIEDKAKFQKFHLNIHPKQSVQLQRVTLIFNATYLTGSDARIFCNGYQSWSESREFWLNEKLPRLKSWAKKHFQYIGDEHIDIPRGRDHFHSWTYTYIKDNHQFAFAGSLNESTAFTYFIHDVKNRQLKVEKDCKGLTLDHSFPILDLFIAKGEENEVFKNWFTEMNLPKLKTAPGIGWTSWYNYYTDISAEIILKNLEAFAEKNIPLDYFQIDDGYQTRVGDWLSLKSSFAGEMAGIAKKIKLQGYQSGIWLAPFICEEASDIFKTKKHWLVKDQNGNPLKVGYVKLWSGYFYALDFYNKEVQDYLSGVIFSITNKWGFNLLKLDFLYAVCAIPRKNKTRGQIMNDAMVFLGNQVGDKLILGCGIPLGSAFGKVGFCRIGPDIHLSWENLKMKRWGNRERTSTLLSLRSTLGRWQLNGNVFHNDPDVFILRDKKNALNPTQQYTLLVINALLGNLVFTSDFIEDYSEEQMSEFDFLFYLTSRDEKEKTLVKNVQNLGNDHYLIFFTNRGIEFAAACNLSNKKASFSVQKNTVDLEAFETLILKIQT